MQKEGRPLSKSEKYDILIAGTYYLLADARAYDLDACVRDCIRDVIRIMKRKKDFYTGSDEDMGGVLERY